MKLLRCYIENFGNLHCYSLEFSPTITTVKEDNGFGKSTLAAFIRAMFYGMPRAAKTLEKNDRKRFLPWQGGLYGGFLEFKTEETAYRIERSFGTTPKQDSFRLYRLEPFSLSNDYSENIGNELFGVGAESFERTTYCSQMHWEGSYTNAELKAQLANLIENTNDMGSFEQAMQRLKVQRSQYIPYRGKGGILSELTAKISALDLQLTEAEKSEGTLRHLLAGQSDTEKLLRQKQQEQTAVAQRIQLAQRQESQKTLANQAQALQQQAVHLQQELDQLLRSYPAGIPKPEELQFLAQGILQLEQPLAEGLSQEEQDYQKQLESLFVSGVPEKEELSALQELHRTYHEKLEARKNAEAEQAAVPTVRIFGSVFLLVFGLIGSVAAFGVYQALQRSYLVPVLLCGGIAAFWGGVVGLVRSRKKKIHRRIFEKQCADLDLDIEELQTDLQNRLTNLGFYRNDLEKSFDFLMKCYDRFIRLQERQRFAASQQLQTRKTLQLQIREFLSQYQLGQLPANRQTFHRLAADSSKYRELMNRKSTLLAQIQAFREQYGDFHTASEELDLEQLLQEQKQIQGVLEELQEVILKQHKEIVELQSVCGHLQQIEYNLHQSLQEREQALIRVKRIDKAMEHLEQAHETLSGRYMEPVKERLVGYLGDLMGIPAETIFVDQDSSVSLQIAGMQRSQAYCSVGEQDMIALCMRAALVDVLYPNQSPLLILDDPLVNLDEAHTKAALKLLRSLGNTHQILYLTCHQSRVL